MLTPKYLATEVAIFPLNNTHRFFVGSRVHDTPMQAIRSLWDVNDPECKRAHNMWDMESNREINKLLDEGASYETVIKRLEDQILIDHFESTRMNEFRGDGDTFYFQVLRIDPDRGTVEACGDWDGSPQDLDDGEEGDG